MTYEAYCLICYRVIDEEIPEVEELDFADYLAMAQRYRCESCTSKILNISPQIIINHPAYYAPLLRMGVRKK